MPRKQPESHEEMVARIALDSMVGQAKSVAAMRGLPPDLRYTTEAEEMELYNQWDEKVDPVAVMQERLQKHMSDGLPPDMAMAEAVVETCAAGFKNRLPMAAAQGRLTLTEQAAWLERQAMKSRRAKEKQQPPDAGADDPSGAPAPDGDAAFTWERKTG